MHFTFSIPQDILGEVSMTNLKDAIYGTSANSNGVETLINLAPTVEKLGAKLNELILALRR